MPYEVKYDDGVQQWSAFFESEEEALAQAVEDTTVYGGTAPQEILDDAGGQVADQAAIEAAAADDG
jgi:ABC-type Fe3+-hydroxamate transport system substrate-binding protein